MCRCTQKRVYTGAVSLMATFIPWNCLYNYNTISTNIPGIGQPFLLGRTSREARRRAGRQSMAGFTSAGGACEASLSAGAGPVQRGRAEASLVDVWGLSAREGVAGLNPIYVSCLQ